MSYPDYDEPYSYDGATQACTAEELVIGDIFPSYDGRLHVITRIHERASGDLAVVVQPGFGQPYGVDYDPEDAVTVML